jgi:hypothetical protein
MAWLLGGREVSCDYLYQSRQSGLIDVYQYPQMFINNPWVFINILTLAVVDASQ